MPLPPLTPLPFLSQLTKATSLLLRLGFTGMDLPGRDQPGRDQLGRDQSGRDQLGRDTPGHVLHAAGRDTSKEGSLIDQARLGGGRRRRGGGGGGALLL